VKDLSAAFHNPTLMLLHQTLRATAFDHPPVRYFYFKMADEPQRFQTGDVVPQTGIYRVAHLAHRLPHEVVIFAGDHFPRCAKCANSVVFELVHAVQDLFQHTVRRVYELPVIEEQRAEEKKAEEQKTEEENAS
jgi:hypothetical protein